MCKQIEKKYIHFTIKPTRLLQLSAAIYGQWAEKFHRRFMYLVITNIATSLWQQDSRMSLHCNLSFVCFLFFIYIYIYIYIYITSLPFFSNVFLISPIFLCKLNCHMALNPEVKIRDMPCTGGYYCYAHIVDQQHAWSNSVPEKKKGIWRVGWSGKGPGMYFRLCTSLVVKH